MAASRGCGRSKCGCGVVQRADGYSGNPVPPITFAASAGSWAGELTDHLCSARADCRFLGLDQWHIYEVFT
jgi:hypothetical protein